MASPRRSPSNPTTSTYGNGTRDYTSLNTWETATDNDLVSAANSEILECYADSATFSDQCTFNGGTYNSTYHRVVQPETNAEHSGILSASGIVIFDDAVSSSQATFQINGGSWTTVQGIQAQQNRNSTQTDSVFYANATDAAIVDCMSDSGENLGTGEQGSTFGVAAPRCTIINSLAYNGENHGFVTNAGTGEIVYYFNCTAVNNTDHGFWSGTAAGSEILVNCLGSGNGTDFETGGFTGSGSDTNACSDTTTPPGTTVYTSQTFTFEDAGGLDFHLSSSDAGAKDRGTDLSGASHYAFDEDIDRTTIVSWSIGWDSDPAAAAGGDIAPILAAAKRARIQNILVR